MIAHLHVIDDRKGERISVGARQAAWLEKHGVIQPDKGGEGGVWFAPLKTIHELNQLILETPEMRECDFCRCPENLWAIKVRRFVTSLGPIERPLYACEGCVPFVRANDKRGLLTYAIDSMVRQVVAEGGELGAHVQRLSRRQVEAAVAPLLTEIITGMFGHRDGWPVRA